MVSQYSWDIVLRCRGWNSLTVASTLWYILVLLIAAWGPIRWWALSWEKEQRKSVSPSEQLSCCLLRNKASSGFLCSFQWYLLEYETCQSINLAHRWLIYLPIAMRLFQSYWNTQQSGFLLSGSSQCQKKCELSQRTCLESTGLLLTPWDTPKRTWTRAADAHLVLVTLLWDCASTHMFSWRLQFCSVDPCRHEQLPKCTTCIPSWQFEINALLRHTRHSVKVLEVFTCKYRSSTKAINNAYISKIINDGGDQQRPWCQT